MNGNIPRHASLKRKDSSRERVSPRLLTAILACIVVMACALPTAFFAIRADQNGRLEFVAENSGRTRILVTREEVTPPWQQLMLNNMGGSPIRGIRAWGLGGMDLLQPAGSSTAVDFRPFNLLPGERFGCIAGASDSTTLFGNFYWENPLNPQMAGEAMDKSKRVTRRSDHSGLLFTARQDLAFAQWRFVSPRPLATAQIAWNQQPANPEAQIWVSLDGKTWGKVGQNPRLPGETTPIADLTSPVAGHDTFLLRMSFGERPENRAEVLVNHLVIERTFQANAQFREWRPGVNEISLAYDSPRNGKLAIRLLP